MRSVIAGLVVLGLLARPAAAAERHVPAEYSTIQAAIDACVAGNAVVVSGGSVQAVYAPPETKIQLIGVPW